MRREIMPLAKALKQRGTRYPAIVARVGAETYAHAEERPAGSGSTARRKTLSRLSRASTDAGGDVSPPLTPARVQNDYRQGGLKTCPTYSTSSTDRSPNG